MQSQTDNDLWSTARRQRLAVIGGGISGLSAAYKLHCETKDLQPPPEILLFEGSPRLGGCISTYNLDDTILELGPDSFITEKPAALELCKRLGITDRLVETDPKHRRTFVANNNKLVPLPEGFLMMAPTQMLPMLNSPLFTWDAKLRMLTEPFVARAPKDADESLTQFVERRLGKEVLDKVVQPLVGGIYTADPDKLSIRAALPRMVQLEQQYGSLVKGLSLSKKNKNESGARYGMFVTFDEGIGVLVNSLVSNLPPGSVRTHSMVSKIRQQGNAWELEFFDGKLMAVDGVVVATSAFHASDIVADLDGTLSSDLSKIDYSSSAVLNLIYRRTDIPHPLNGFGFVVPRTEKRTILACSFTSVKWPDRAPQDKTLLRVFVGGALQPDVYNLADEEIECLMWEDLHTYLGIKALPLLSVISRFPRSMPQYNVGHVGLVEKIDASIAKYPGLALAGNAYRGVGIPDCVASGEAAAAAILEHAVVRAKSS
jgi:protoporphyrinogen/coproporphyrinogen III oxidase